MSKDANLQIVSDAAAKSRPLWKIKLTAFLEAIKARRQARVITKILQDEARMNEADLKERQAIARAFNNRYVLGDRYFKEDVDEFDGPDDGWGTFGMRVARGNAWMCPTCNTIHRPIKMTTFGGLYYPRCCDLPAGSRHDNLPSKASLKRPIGESGHNGIYYRKLRAGLDPILGKSK